jgi:enterochelin esterase-like enzyme
MTIRKNIDHVRRQCALGGCAVFALATGKVEATAAAGSRRPPAQQWTSEAVSAPGVQYHSFFSTAARSVVGYQVFVPPGYAADRARRYPVLLWLHGSGGGLQGIAPLAQRFGSAMAAGQAPPFIVVFPNGLRDSLWVDSKDGRVPMETVVMDELLPHVDATFYTRPDRGDRAVEGFSMGGYGAARFGLKYPQRFGAVSMLAAGPLQPTLSAAVGPTAKADARERVFAMVFDRDQQYFIDNSPWSLAEQHAMAARSPILLRQVIGTADTTLPANRAFHERMLALGLPHEYSEVPGVGHSVIALIDAQGDRFWAFHRAAFGAQR